jgi:hypothetical protein
MSNCKTIEQMPNFCCKINSALRGCVEETRPKTTRLHESVWKSENIRPIFQPAKIKNIEFSVRINNSLRMVRVLVTLPARCWMDVGNKISRNNFFSN